MRNNVLSAALLIVGSILLIRWAHQAPQAIHPEPKPQAETLIAPAPVNNQPIISSKPPPLPKAEKRFEAPELDKNLLKPQNKQKFIKMAKDSVDKLLSDKESAKMVLQSLESCLKANDVPMQAMVAKSGADSKLPATYHGQMDDFVARARQGCLDIQKRVFAKYPDLKK